MKLENLGELYGTAVYAVDKLNGEMYAVIEELEELEGAVWFAPKDIQLSKI